ncbi:hypothetical protein ACFL5Q_01180 [Planctomycetota bacterium]
MRTIFFATLTVAPLVLPSPCLAGEAPEPSRKTQRSATGLSGNVLEILASLNSPNADEDFAAVCLDREGTPWVAYVEFDGRADTLQVVRLASEGFTKVGALSRPGNIYQPCLARDGAGTIWCVWSQLEGGRWNLYARSIVGGKPSGRAVPIADSQGNAVFPDLETDPQGRVWVAWQSFDRSCSEIFTRYYDPRTEAWSAPIRVTNHPAGDWEPRLAFAAGGEALIVFDSYRNGNFDVFLARVSPAGQVDLSAITTSDRYQGRPEAAAALDGASLWVAYEDGVSRWGKDLGSEWRQLGGGLHFDRHLYLARVDLATGKTRRVADVTPLVPSLLATLGQPTSGSICLPELIVDNAGCPWLFFRHGSKYWEVAVTKYDPAEDTWTQPQRIAQTSYCQDRRTSVAKAADGSIYVVCSSDLRTGNDQGDSGIRLARLDPRRERPVVDAAALAVEQKRAAPAFEPVNATPERARDRRDRWQHEGDRFTLFWGDLHRHTDFSNCRSPDDGCIVEHFRYAYDAGGIDFLATTDHSDQGRGYTDYEWWQTQKLADMFHTPGFFLTLYGYEREQRGPYGHRNVFFKERGGPIVYINRDRFADSKWGKQLGLPPQAGARQGDLSPPQLWQLLRKSGMDAISISHTPAGNDWSLFDRVDTEVEPVMEIYQGSRQSYEGAGTPQPKVANQKPAGPSRNPGRGRYQDALSTGHRLGAIASSDHRSTNISFAGVYLKTFDRDGLFEAIRARRTVAATDKILMHVSCNGHTLGEEFSTTERPTLALFVDGTAPLETVTVIRNEAVVYSRRITGDASTYEGTYRDEQPLPGENRYYLRVEQTDGNMGWTSPVWVNFER